MGPRKGSLSRILISAAITSDEQESHLCKSTALPQCVCFCLPNTIDTAVMCDVAQPLQWAESYRSMWPVLVGSREAQSTFSDSNPPGGLGFIKTSSSSANNKSPITLSFMLMASRWWRLKPMHARKRCGSEVGFVHNVKANVDVLRCWHDVLCETLACPSLTISCCSAVDLKLIWVSFWSREEVFTLDANDWRCKIIKGSFLLPHPGCKLHLGVGGQVTEVEINSRFPGGL